MLSGVEWGEYRISDLFERVSTLKLPYKAKDLPSSPEGEFDLPCLTSSFMNQGLNYYVPKSGATILQSVISIPSNSDVYRAYYQSAPFTVLSDAYAIRWIYEEGHPSSELYLFLVSCINKVTDLPIYSYKNKLGGWNVVRKKYIQLPTRDGKIDFEFMERFVAELKAQRVAELKAQRVVELKAYLAVTGLSDYTLTREEQQAIQHFQEGNLQWHDYRLGDLFGEATRGKRLKSDDRIAGSLPFVTAGEAETGVSAFIGNSVEVFPANTITIDMFGSTKYRNYSYGADDHVAVVHTQALPKHAVCFITTAIHKVANAGAFHYGRNFYAKDAAPLHISLLSKSGEPDYTQMETFIRAIEKLVIRDVVLYADRELAATEQVINQ